MTDELARSIQRQHRSKLIIAHGCEIISGINVSRLAEKEFVKSFERARTQRITGTSKGDLRKKRLGAWNGHRLEMIQNMRAQ